MINKVTLVGRVGLIDASNYKEFESGTVSFKFSLATTSKWYSKASQSYEKEITWHSIETWGHTAKFCKQYVSKGDQLYVEGSIKVHEYEKGGEKKKFTAIAALNVQKIGSAARKQEEDTSEIPF